MDLEDVVDRGFPVLDETDGVVAEEAEPKDEYMAIDETDEIDIEEGMFAERVRRSLSRRKSSSAKELLPHFPYCYRDTESRQDELNEWFDAYEDHLADCKHAFEAQFGRTRWRTTDMGARNDFVRSLLMDNGGINSDGNLYALAYIAQGIYGEVWSVEDHMQRISMNCKILWQQGALPILYEQFCILNDQKIDDCTQAHAGSSFNAAKETRLSLIMTIIYFMIECLRTNPDFSSHVASLDPPILPYLVSSTAQLRWISSLDKYPTKRLLLLTWKCILCVFGHSSRLRSVKRYMHRKFGLPEEHSKDHGDSVITSSPLDYHAFREDLISRYPSYLPPPSGLPKIFDNDQTISQFIQVPRPAHSQASNASLPPPAVHLATPAPSPPASPAIAAGQKVRKSVFMTNQAFPFLYPSEDKDVIPQSIIEAGELFASRVRNTPAIIQLWEERDRFIKSERGYVDHVNGSATDSAAEPSNGSTTDRDSNQKPNSELNETILSRIEDFYKQSFPELNSFVNVVLKVMLKSVSFDRDDYVGNEELRAREINLKSTSAICSLLLKWLKVNHVLKFEYFSALLFDSRYYLLVYKFLYSHDPLERALTVPEVAETTFCAKAAQYSPYTRDYGQCGKSGLTPPTNYYELRGDVSEFSERFFFSIINMLKTLRAIIKGKTQRVIVVAELPSETLKTALKVYHDDLWKLVLSIFKEQVPFNGRRWKYNNMDLVSAIYLHCKAKLRDDWLAGLDVAAEVDDAYDQEAAMRALTKFYNDNLFYAPSGPKEPDMDFFTRELRSLSLNSRQ